MHWESCGFWRVVVRYHVEVKYFVVVEAHDLTVDDCSTTNVGHIAVCSFKDSRGHSLVHENEKQVRVVA